MDMLSPILISIPFFLDFTAPAPAPYHGDFPPSLVLRQVSILSLTQAPPTQSQSQAGNGSLAAGNQNGSNDTMNNGPSGGSDNGSNNLQCIYDNFDTDIATI